MRLVNRKNFITGMTGVYCVAAELSSRGFLVTLTSRNAPIVDMMVSTPDLTKTTNVQVKTNKVQGTQSFWLLSREARNSSPNLLYVFVNLRKNEKPNYYIVPSNRVAKEMDVEHTKGGVWFSFARNERDKNRWDLFD